MHADRLIEYAELALNLEQPRVTPPEQWQRIQYWKNRMTGLTAAVYRCERDGEVVIAWRGVRAWNPRDVLGALVRRRCGYSRQSLLFARSVVRAYGRNVTIIGHSGGGGLASWLGQKLRVASVTFNSGRTKWSLLNDGHKQTNVCIRGDFWGDPWNGLYSMPLPGRYLVLDRPVGSRGTHGLAVVIGALREAPNATDDRSAVAQPIKAPSHHP